MSGDTEPAYTADKVRDILQDVLAAFNNPENVSKLEEARLSAGNDMVKLMKTSFPIVAQIQMDIISKHGFRGDGEGAVRFILATKALEKEDAEIANLNALVRPYFMPSMTSSTNQSGETLNS